MRWYTINRDDSEGVVGDMDLATDEACKADESYQVSLIALERSFQN